MAQGTTSSSRRRRSIVRHGAWLLAAAALVTLPAVQARAGKSVVNRIASVTSQSGGASTLVRVRGSATPTFTVYKLDRPERIVVDISNAQLGDGRDATGELLRNINSWSVQRVAAHQVDRGRQRAVRLVVSLARAGRYRVVTEGNDLIVKVTARQPAPAQQADSAAHQRAADARREAEQMMKRAAEVEKQARELAERAKQEVAQARAQAASARKSASAQEREIERRLREAQAMRRAAEKELTEARRARTEADAQLAQAQRSMELAQKARADAEEQRQLADKATRVAKVAQKRAREAARQNRSDTAALEAKARRALAQAAEHEQKADRAEALARKRSARAQSEKDAADKRGREIARKLALAEKERERAAAERQLAEAARAQAEADRSRAESMAETAARRAAELERAAREAEKRARAAKQVRQREERALAEAARARAAAESQRAEAEKAKQRLEKELAALRQAEREARSRRDAAARAGNTSDSSDRAAAKKAAADAERELAARRHAVDQLRAQLTALDEQRDQAGAELRQLERAADKARRERQAEERRVAELASARADAERELAAAKAERARLSKESAAAAEAMQAERERAAKEVADARREAKRAREEAQRARAQAEKSRQAEAESRAAAERARVAEAEARKAAETSAQRRAAANRAARSDRAADRRPRATAYSATEVASYGTSSGAITQQSVSQLRRRKVYRGRKIDLDFKDADIHNLLRMLADVGGVNIVVPDDIKASVTVRLRDVPWDQAMEVILASKGLWYRREGNLIRVADRKELEAEEEAERARIQALAQSEAPEPEVFTLNYADASNINEQLKPLLSPKGRIEVDQRTNSLIINDIRAHRRRIIDLVNRLDTQTPQIQIEARIVEARTTFLREFGIQWGGNLSASPAGGNATGLIFPNSVGVRGGAEDNQTPLLGVPAPSDFAVNLPAAVGTGAGGAIGLSLGSVGGNVNLNLRLSALEDSGSVRIISAPKITTSNNMQALIKSGVSIPISVISANGVQTQFVPADLALEVTPSVSQRDCSVSMQVNVTKNEADFVNTGARGDPSILTKEARTTILVEDSQTAVIGGIYTRNTGVSYSKVPFFGDLPVIGWFFKTRRENDDRSEVLVFITPKITNRAFLRCE